MSTQHIRQPLLRKRGNSFYRDTTVYATTTLCGAHVTDRDVDFRYGGTKRFTKWALDQPGVCPECLHKRSAGVA